MCKLAQYEKFKLRVERFPYGDVVEGSSGLRTHKTEGQTFLSQPFRPFKRIYRFVLVFGLDYFTPDTATAVAIVECPPVIGLLRFGANPSLDLWHIFFTANRCAIRFDGSGRVCGLSRRPCSLAATDVPFPSTVCCSLTNSCYLSLVLSSPFARLCVSSCRCRRSPRQGRSQPLPRLEVL